MCHLRLNDEEKAVDFDLVKLDWASTENGSHILMVCLANQVFIYSCVRKDSIKTLKAQTPSSNLGSIGEETNELESYLNITTETIKLDSVVKWVRMRSFTLDSADDMQALPTQIKWVRDGLLIVGLNTEMQVYSQWSPTVKHQLHNYNSKAIPEPHFIIPKNHSVLDLNKLNKLTNEQLKANKNLRSESSEQIQTESKNSRVYNENKILETIQDSGAFVQAASQFPTLPQYHPKQLLELMNSGKINRVKAILMHLTRCIIDSELNSKSKHNDFYMDLALLK